jgi:hypothetical protein
MASVVILISLAVMHGKKAAAAVGFVILVLVALLHSRVTHGIQQTIAVHILALAAAEYFLVAVAADSLHVHVIAADARVVAHQV